MSKNRMNIQNLLSPDPAPDSSGDRQRQAAQSQHQSNTAPQYQRTASASHVYTGQQPYSQQPSYNQPSYSQQSHQGYGSSSISASSPLAPLPAVPSTTASTTNKRPVTSKPRRKEAPLIQRAVTSPRHYDRTLTPTLPHSAVVQAQHLPSPSLTSASTVSTASAITPGLTPGWTPGSAGSRYSSIMSTPTGDFRSPSGHPSARQTPPPISRQTTTEKMDFLADVASMQQVQQTQARSVRASMSVHDLPRSPQPPPLSRRTSVIPSPVDHMMSDAPTATLQSRTFKASSLTTAELQTVSALTKQLSENSFLYDTHTQLIKILQEGLQRHILPPGSNTPQNPHDYSLLLELRQARDAMDSRFPVGEEIWIEWIQDEAILAQTSDDRAAVMELCQKAVSDEVGSAKLWRLYGDWMWHLFKTAYDISGLYEGSALEAHPVVGLVLSQQRWTEEDKALGPELFQWDSMLDVWRSGVKATSWHINDSQVVWDPFMQILLADLASSPSDVKVDEIKRLFNERLRTPHATWDDTFQSFSQFISRYDNRSYEMIMVETNQQALPAKNEFSLRGENEQKLASAAASGDRNTEWTVMTEYLDWEATQTKQHTASRASFDLFSALYERAHLRFPTDAELWENHVDDITEHPRADTQLLPLTYNATRHCPWSGSLWSKRLIALELSGSAFEEMEDTKHHATSSGLLEEVGGIEELIKVQTAWCGFLRRRAFGANAGEDEADMAEVGIRSALESIKTLGERKQGKAFKGDPDFQVERIYLKFLTQALRHDEARAFWEKLSSTHGDRWEYWERYYTWELAIWSRSAPGTRLPPPTHATSVLQKAVHWPNLDWPEKMIEMYLHHCRQHETVRKVQEAHVEARKASKLVAARRAQEAEAASAAQAQYQAMDVSEDATNTGKRKLRDGEDLDETSAKRTKSEAEPDQPQHDASSSATAQVKRDRENTTVIVRNIPASTTEARLEQYFRSCGTLLSVTIVSDENDSTATATLEFESKEDVLSAMTRNMKIFDGNAIEIQVGTGTTLYVTNYPPEADEDYIRNLFKQFGDIVDVRFPSLKYNTHRRFCYVQFITSAAAQAATSMHGKALSGGLTLQALLSDPAAKKNREGAKREGREVYVGNMHYKATNADIENLFSPYGTVDSVRIPRNMEGKAKGASFVIFATKEEAKAAADGLNTKDFMGRILKVEVSTENAKGSKRSAATIISNASASPAPEASAGAGSPPADNTNTAPHDSSNHPIPAPSTTTTTASSTTTTTTHTRPDHHARTLRLRNIPDTINDARIRALVEPFGALKKITVRPEKHEAHVEFVNQADVGRAEMALQGHEIVKGVKIEVGIPGRKDDGKSAGAGGGGGGGGAGGGGGGGGGSKSMPFAPVTATRRPQQGQGKRGGLGIKRGGGGITGANAVSTRGGRAGAGPRDTEMSGQDGGNAGSGSGAGKSNDDFRKLMEGGK